MSSVAPALSKIDRLSLLVEEDILRKRLREGDRYLTSDEAGKQFGVSRATAHRAFQLLVDREMLVSKPRLGTFVGPASPYRNLQLPRLKCVHAVIDPERLHAGLSIGELLDGLKEVLPDFDLQVNYLPSASAADYMAALLANITRDNTEIDGTLSQGLVVLGCPRIVQEMVAAAEVPAVILGSRYPTAASIPSITVDNVAKGQLLTQYLLNRGHKRIALLMRETWLPGDRLMFEGINQQLAKAEMPHGTLDLRSVPADRHVIRAELSECFLGANAPTALICQQRFADLVAGCLAEMNLQVPTDIDMVIETTDHRTETTSKLVHSFSEISFPERVRRAGKLLGQLLAGEESNSTAIFPIQLIYPGVSNS